MIIKSISLEKFTYSNFSDTVLPLRKLLWIAHSMEYKHSGCRYPDLSGNEC